MAGFLAALIASGIIAATTAAVSAGVNYKSQQETNAANIAMQRETNAQNQYNIEHAHQMEMRDLEAAGLNPILTATGGSGAPVSMLQSPKAAAPQLDLSGVQAAISGMTNALSMSMMMDMRQEMSNERNATLSAIAKGHDSQSAANAALRASLYKKQGEFNINSGKNWYQRTHGVSDHDFARLSKLLKTQWVRR